MAQKSKVQIYIPVKENWDELVEKVVELRKSEGHTYTPWYGMDYTVSEVVIDALKALLERSEGNNKNL